MELMDTILIMVGGILIGVGHGVENKNMGVSMITSGSVLIAMTIYHAI